MQAAAGGTILRNVLTPTERLKLDTNDDRQFYDFPRLVKHVDDGFLAQVTELYRQVIPAGGSVLDLCSSWVSHLPPEVKYGKVIGHGMNAAELARNERLDSFFVRDLNKAPDGWALQDSSFDAVTCCVSIQYMQQPERVLAEIHRVLKPGGLVIITFSNRLFYTKAIAAWRGNSGFGRVQLVKQYIRAVEGFSEPEALTQVKLGGSGSGSEGSGAGGLVRSLAKALPGPLAALAKLPKLFERASNDPFYAVIAQKLP